jgi:GNAT superfamily N-acetyltransferase
MKPEVLCKNSFYPYGIMATKKTNHGPLTFHFRKPGDIDHNALLEIENLVRQGKAVGTRLLRDNLRNAFLVGYATEPGGKVIGTVTLKVPQETYRKKLEKATGFNLSGYLERGYTSVAPAYRGLKVGHQLIRGLVQRSKGERIYLTIRMDNTYALKLTYENKMTLASTFINERTGHEIGLFVNT